MIMEFPVWHLLPDWHQRPSSVLKEKNHHAEERDGVYERKPWRRFLSPMAAI